MKKPVLLLILDGYGLSENKKGNAVMAANTPAIRKLFEDYPFVQGAASGLAVGLPEGQMGNSEVGHLNMGAGRVVYQDLTRITKSIEDGDFFEYPELLNAIENCKKNNSDLHIWGLLSDGGVHSLNKHLYAILKLAADKDFHRVYVHAIMDGRDTAPKSGQGFLEELEQMCKKYTGKVATVCGRYWFMDRDNRWERVEKAYKMLTLGEGIQVESSAQAIEGSYAADVTDEFVEPTVITENGKPLATVKDGDSVIFFNFRPDRAREISRCFCCDDFTGFERGERIKTDYVCFTDYDVTIPNKSVVFKEQEIEETFGQFLAHQGLNQARIAETEKYAHVTFFFNGGVEAPNPGEERILVPSPKVATYDMQPEMSAPAVCEKIVETIKAGQHDVIIANFANPDMVGHTGVFDAVVKALETIDGCVGKIVEAIKEVDGAIFLCADHGNAEELINPETGEAWTAHTTNPVPFVLINASAYAGADCGLKQGGRLCDIVPTIIDLMGLKQPKEMTGESLLVRK